MATTLEQARDAVVADPRYQELKKTNPDLARQKLENVLRRAAAELPTPGNEASPFLQDLPEAPLPAPSKSLSAIRATSLLFQGMSDAAESLAFLPATAIDEALKMAGLVSPGAKPIGSSVKETFQQFHARPAETATERIFQRTGEFIGEATFGLVPAIGAANQARQAVQAERLLPVRLNEEGITAKTKDLGRAIALTVERLSKEDPRLLLLGDALLAAPSGFTGASLREAFPESPHTAEAFGQLLGALGPQALGLMLKSALSTSFGFLRRGFYGLTRNEIREDMSARLQHMIEPDLREIDRQLSVAGPTQRQALQEQRQALMDRLKQQTDHMMQTVKGLQDEFGVEPTLGQVGEAQGLRLTERNVAGQSAGAVTKFDQRLQANRQKVVGAVLEARPAGDEEAVMNLVKQTERQRVADYDFQLSRAQGDVDAANATIEGRTRAVLHDAEQRFQQAEQRALQAVQSLEGQGLTRGQLGRILRDELEKEVADFRATASQAYDSLDPDGRVRVSVSGIKQARQELLDELTPDVVGRERVPESIMQKISNLGVDYELQLRAHKALADLGAREAGGPGGRFFDDEGQFQTGLSRGTPDWYKNLTTGNNKLDRATVMEVLQSLSQRQTLPKGMQQKTFDHVVTAIRNDREFSNSPFNDSALLEALEGQPSETFNTVKDLRSELLAQLRLSKAQRNDPLSRRLEILVDATERQLDDLADKPAYQAVSDDLHARWKDTSTWYRSEVIRLKQGVVAAVRQRDVTGRLKVKDEEVAEKFLAGETPVDDFVNAIGNREQAVLALQQSARVDFLKSSWNPRKQAFDEGAARVWLANHEDFLRQFPELGTQFQNVIARNEVFQSLRKQSEDLHNLAITNPEKVAALLNSRDPLTLQMAQRKLEDVHAAFRQSTGQFQRNTASLYLKADVGKVANQLISSKDPRGKIQEVLGFLGQHQASPEAIEGFQRSLFDAVTAKFQSKAAAASGPGPLANVMREMLTKHGGWMGDVFGQEKMTRLTQAVKALEILGQSDRPIVKGGSDTALNLVTIANEISPLLSRWFAVQSGRVAARFGLGERVARKLNQLAIDRTQQEVTALMEEAFFNPEVGRTLLMAYQGKEPFSVIRGRLRGHYLAMGFEAVEGQAPQEERRPAFQPALPTTTDRGLLRPSTGIAVLQ